MVLGEQQVQASVAVALGVVLSVVLSGCTVLAPVQGLESAGTGLELQGGFTVLPNGTMRVHFVNVGQGDGVVWELPGGGVVVYDCGDAVASANDNPVVQHLRRLGLSTGATIHALIASHGHADHVAGCEEVLQEYRVLHLYEVWFEGAEPPQSYVRFRDQLKAEGGLVHVLAETPMLDGEVPFRAGDEVDLPEAARAAGVRAEILWPIAPPASRWGRIAESSIVVRLSFGSVDFCFPGDIETPQEAALTERFAGKDCEVYLVGHHGSRYASSARWLEAMDPEVAVVSFGENDYRHPTSEALCRVQVAGAKLYATHRVGSIAVSTEGDRVEVQPPSPEVVDYCQPGARYWP